MVILFYITLCLLLFYGGLIIFYFISWKEIPEQYFSGPASELVRVTVIIPARDEEHNIARCLESLRAQTYPGEFFQVIVINDHSTDQTASVVRKFPLSNLLLLNLEDFLEAREINSYKKKAIELGIKNATGDLILCTDADCVAAPDWIKSMVQSYLHTRAVFIAAPVKIQAGRNILSIFQTLDFLSLQGITAAAVHRNMHAMSNGANLAYTKKAFLDVGGFQGIDKIASGDDMLLMQKIAAAYPGKISYLKSKQAIITTTPETTLRAFIHQRVRWASKAGSYKDASISSILLLVYLTNLSIAVFFIATFFHTNCFHELLLLLGLKTLLEIFFVNSVAKFFAQDRLMIWFPVIQPVHIFYTIIAGWLGIFGSYEWKKRRVK